MENIEITAKLIQQLGLEKVKKAIQYLELSAQEYQENEFEDKIKYVFEQIKKVKVIKKNYLTRMTQKINKAERDIILSILVKRELIIMASIANGGSAISLK